MPHWVAISPAIILPKLEGGVDWGGPRRVLLQVGTKRVWWRAGHTAWSSRGCQGYYPAVLYLHDSSKDKLGKRIQEGGRLSKALLAQLTPQIAEFTGLSAIDLPVMKPNLTWAIKI